MHFASIFYQKLDTWPILRSPTILYCRVKFPTNSVLQLLHSQSSSLSFAVPASTHDPPYQVR